MPYIDSDRRKFLESKTYKELLNSVMEMEIGDMNFLISNLVWLRFIKAPSYSTGNAMVGVLECAKLEFYRKQLAELEDRKIPGEWTAFVRNEWGHSNKTKDSVMYTSDALIFNPGPQEITYDPRTEEGEKRYPTGYIELKHSCDEWKIGGPEEIRLMIKDLETALKLLEGDIIR